MGGIWSFKLHQWKLWLMHHQKKKKKETASAEIGCLRRLLSLFKNSGEMPMEAGWAIADAVKETWTGQEDPQGTVKPCDSVFVILN